MPKSRIPRCWKDAPIHRHRGRETGEVRKVFTGDRSVAARYTNIGRTILADLKLGMRFQALRQGRRRVVLPDGTRIEAISVPGQDVVVIRAQEAGVVQGQAEQKVSCIMETGLVVVAVDFSGEPLAWVEWSGAEGTAAVAGYIPPLLIYAGAGLQEYFEGDGTVLPGGEHADVDAPVYLVQGIDDPALTCPQDPDRSIPDWPTDAPELGAELQTLMSLTRYEAYSSVVYIEHQKLLAITHYCSPPGRYSGLLKLAAQAKLGRGSSPVALAAWSDTLCRLESGRDGLFRDEAGVYWLFRIDVNGCYAHRMRVADCMLCVDQWIKDGLGSAEDLVKYQALVFSALTPDPQYADVELVSGDVLQDVYDPNVASNDYYKNALGLWGWHYSHGHLGTGDGELYEASIVTHEYGKTTTAYRSAYRYKIVFDLNGDVPTAAFSVEESGVQWEPSVNDLIFYPHAGVDGNKLCYVARSTSSVPQGANAPLYCWYYPDKEMEIIRYSWRVTDNSPSADDGHSKLCGAGVYNHLQTRPPAPGPQSKAFAGGITADVAGVGDETQIPFGLGIWVYDEIYMEASSTGSCSWTGERLPQVTIWAKSSVCNGFDTNSWPTAGVKHTWIEGFGSGWRNESYIRGNDVNGVRILIIPHGECEAVYLAELFAASMQYQDRSRYDDPSISYGRTLIVQVDLSKDGFNQEVRAPLQPLNNLPMTNCGGSFYIAGFDSVYLGICCGGQTYETANAVLITNHGVFNADDGYLSKDYDDWHEWILYTEGFSYCESVEQWTQVSYVQPEVYYSYGPSIEKALIGKRDWPPNTGNEGYAVDVPWLFDRVAFLGWN